MLKKIWKMITDSFNARENEFYDNIIAPTRKIILGAFDREKIMPDRIYKYLFIGKYTFVLRYEYSKITKGYTTLILSKLWDNGHETEINGYYLDQFVKRGHLLGKIELDERINRDIRNYLKEIR